MSINDLCTSLFSEALLWRERESITSFKLRLLTNKFLSPWFGSDF